MRRYIDAKHFDQRVRIAGGMSEDELTEDFKDGVLATLALLETEPTADVVEVVHGEWKDGYKRQSCSVCHYRGMRSWNYCPNCGADMRGEEDDKGRSNEMA